MRPQRVTLSAAGFSPWLNINRMPKGNFGVALAVKLSSGASLTYSVQHTSDPLYNASTQEWSASRTTTTGTITKTNHGLSVGDWTQMDAAAPFNTAYAVASVVDANNYTITVPDSGVASVGKGTANLWTARVSETSGMSAQTASKDGNYVVPPTACRLVITSYTSGFADLDVRQVG